MCAETNGSIKVPEHIDNQEHLSHQDELLMQSVKRHDIFGTDETDEFQIARESGQCQGIFKTWAAPVIASLETGITEPNTASQEWMARVENKPLSVFEGLERWRSFSTESDRRLQMIFNKRLMPEQPREAVIESFARLTVAFALSAPFYHLEALVADNRKDQPDNPIDFEANGGGGKLDAIAMLLPAAMKDQLQANTGNWNGLAWEQISERVEAMRQAFLSGSNSVVAQQFVQLNRVAALAGIDSRTALFAANALEFIAAPVGGKSGDMPSSEALDALELITAEPTSTITTGHVARDTNALIRFLNWTPAIIHQDNFEGKHWTYDAACKTAKDLVDITKEHARQLFDGSFADVFQTHLAPQLDGLDAASAKGRFMLQLLHEGKFAHNIFARVQSHTAVASAEIFEALQTIRESEAVLTSQNRATAHQIGGKAMGLLRAAGLFGSEHIVDGKVATTEAVNDWLNAIEGMPEHIRHLDTVGTIDEKILLAAKITKLIQGAEAPAIVVKKLSARSQKIVLRSSSFDEDTDLIGPAPGIYDSVIGIDATNEEAVGLGFKKVVSSFFSEKAVSFRELKGLQHKPVMAVLAQEFVDGPGGTVFIQDGRVELNIAPSPEEINTISCHTNVERFSLDLPNSLAGTASKFLDGGQIADITRKAGQAEAVFGASDIEFVLDPGTSTIKLLQMRRLERPVRLADIKNAEHMIVASVVDLNKMPEVTGEDNVNLHIDASIDLEKFQGSLFRWIVQHRDTIKVVTLTHEIPQTCHFANILGSFGIRIETGGKTI